jgi:hypothetical protein
MWQVGLIVIDARVAATTVNITDLGRGVPLNPTRAR